MNEDLVDLSSAHVTQHTVGHVKSDWSVKKNLTEDLLGVFPNTIDDTLMFKILDFAKEFELKALNIGINHGKKITVTVYDKKISLYEEVLKEMRAENEKLATALEYEMLKNTQ